MFSCSAANRRATFIKTQRKLQRNRQIFNRDRIAADGCGGH
jgi:hypothetical protein